MPTPRPSVSSRAFSGLGTPKHQKKDKGRKKKSRCSRRGLAAPKNTRERNIKTHPLFPQLSGLATRCLFVFGRQRCKDLTAVRVDAFRLSLTATPSFASFVPVNRNSGTMFSEGNTTIGGVYLLRCRQMTLRLALNARGMSGGSSTGILPCSCNRAYLRHVRRRQEVHTHNGRT
jgi:hypothetical protein